MDHKTHFISRANSYKLRNQGATIFSNIGSQVQKIFQALFTHIPSLKLKILKCSSSKLHNHIAASTLPHSDKPPLLHIHSRTTSWAVSTNIRSNIRSQRIPSCKTSQFGRKCDGYECVLQEACPCVVVLMQQCQSNDGTLVPKQVGAGTWYLVPFVIYFIVFQLVYFIGF